MNCNQSTLPVKLCRVCGDRAIAFNFNGLTCESCKSFFRRNACKLAKLKCTKNKNCTISMQNRNACKGCRLQKCLSIGMKKDLVLEKRQKLLKIEKISEIKKLDFETNDDIGGGGGSMKLNTHERLLIAEVNHSNSSVFLEETKLKTEGEIKTFTDGLNVCAVYVRKVIKFCKFIPAFRQLEQSDQLRIVKPFFTELLLVRFIFTYDFVHDAYVVFANEKARHTLWMKFARLEDVNRGDFARVYRKFVISSKSEIENDSTIRNLLATILMFSSRDDVSCPEFLRYHDVRYRRLLARYLEHKYHDATKAAEKFAKLIFIVDGIRHYRIRITELYTLCEQRKLLDVLAEIYDLNNIRFDNRIDET